MKSGGICAFPDCRRELIIYPTEEVIGEICHIVAKKVDGPRGNHDMPMDERDKEGNLLML